MDKEIREIGEDVFIHDTAIIKRPHLCSIGSHNAIDNGVTISTTLIMGDYIHIAPYVTIIGGEPSTLIMEDFSFLGSGTRVVCGGEDFSGKGLIGPTIPKEFRVINYTTIKIGRFGGTAVNCVILPDVTMAEGSVLGANSLLREDTEPWGIYVGSPARLIGYRDKDTILANAKKLGYEF